MKKYKQAIIPSVKIKTHTNSCQYVKNEYTSLIQGKSVINKHIGLTIYFGSDGKAELAYGRAIYAKKAALVQCLLELMREAEYTSFGQRKVKDDKNIFGYAKFKAKVYIDGKLENVHIVVVVKSNGKAYYCHEVNIKK